MITNTQRRHDIVGTGGAGPFSYQFMILNDTDLAVYVDGNLKTLTTHYTVSGVGNESGGTITFTTGNYPALSADIIVLGAEPETQTHDFQVAATLPAASLEESVDKLTRLVQQLTERVNRSPVLPVGDSGGFSALTLPAPGDGQYLRWSGNQLALGTPTLVPDGVPAGGGNYDHLIVNGGGAVAWGQALYHYAANFKNIALYGNSLSNVVSSIGGSTKVCLLISESISVTGNVTVTDNITFFFVGAGGLAISSGVTVTYNAASFLVDDIRRQRFTGAGTFDGANLSEVIPDQWGADATGTSDSLAACLAATASLPAGGGTVKLLAGTYDLSNSWDITKHLIIEGQGAGVTILNVTANSSLQHGLDTTFNLTVRHCTIQMETALTTNQNMKAINQDLAGTGLSGRTLTVEHVKIRGFNIGIFSDGDTTYGVDSVIYRDVDVQISGPAANFIASCLYFGRVAHGEMDMCRVDQNGTGDHAIYCFGGRNLDIHDVRVRNATRTEAQAIKLVGDGLGSGSIYPYWSIRNADIEDCTHGILVSVYNTEKLRACIIDNVSCTDVTGTINVPAPIMVTVSDTAIIRSIRIANLTYETLGYGGVYFSMATGAEISRATVADVYAYNWSTTSAGTYALINATDNGTLRLLTISNVYADGNSNGRTIWFKGGIGTSCKRLVCSGLREASTVTPGTPSGNTDLDTTPSLALGNVFDLTNSGATSITQFDDLVRGETYLLRFMDGNTTLVDGTNLITPGSTNLTPGATDIYSVYTPDGTKAYVSSGSNN